MPTFNDRRDAGRQLAARLHRFAGRNDVVVLGLPRGGVPVAFEVARAIDAPLDVFAVRKLGAPGHSELGMGAIAMGGVRVLNSDLIQYLRVTPQEIEAVTAAEQRELDRRIRAYRDSRPFPVLRDVTVILVDDGVATGSTMAAAVRALREHHPAAIVVAAPVMSIDAEQLLASVADECECVETPVHFFGVGGSYEDFTQTTDEEVRGLLQLASDRRRPAAEGASHAVTT
jgi:putative phosphoribosyl transferase